MSDRARFWRRFKALAAAALTAACGSIDAEPRAEASFELLTWWTAPGESNALEALLEDYRTRHDGTDVTMQQVLSRKSAQDVLDAAMLGGAPPDSFLTVGGEDLARWVEGGNGNSLRPLGPVVDRNAFSMALPAFVRNAISLQGEIYAFPVDVPRLNVLYYNVRVLADAGVTPPTTLDEFTEVAAALRARGIVPLALGGLDGAVISQLFFDAVLAKPSVQAFRDSYLEGDENPEDPRIATAVDELATILGFANQNVAALSWTQAARDVVTGAAAMTFTGDWAKAFFESAGFEPGTELGQVVFPGTQGMFVYLTDAFALPVGAPHPRAAENFMRLLSEPAVRNKFVSAKGTMAAWSDFEAKGYDVLATQNANDFRSSMRIVQGHIAKIRSRDFLIELDRTMREFAIDRDAAAVRNMLRNRYGQL